MRQLIIPAWGVALAAGALLSAGLLAYSTCRGPLPTPLPPRQERRLRARVAADLRRMATDTLRAARAADRGRYHYAAGQAAARQAQLLHRQTHAHASPPPVTDTAAQRLQRLLSAY